MTKIPIARNEPLDAGDVVELHFASFGGTWIKAAQIAAVERLLEHEKRWKIKSWELRDDARTLVFQVRVLKTNPAAITAAAIISSIITLAMIVGILLTFYAAYKIVSEVAEVTKTPVGAVMGIAAAAIIGAIAVTLLRKK